MANRLEDENSPYLLQHANNPVDWYPWGVEALEKSRREDKPIFLSIGYAACHWCHVMAHESFEDVEIAAIMNESFVNIKVDREERPDLDGIYMSAVVAMSGHGGWPMSVFLTPNGEPFYGGTYFPPVRRYNMPSFREVILSISRLWRDDRDRLLQSGNEIVQHLQTVQSFGFVHQPLDPTTLDQAAFRLAQTYDWQNGGWGKAPKFPQPMAIEFLLRRAGRGDRLAQDIAVHALDSMSKGGMYDVVGGGFSRYSTDDRWLVPHFEKMLYDNAQLAQVNLQAYMITGNNHYRQICEQTLDYLAREMLDPAGGIYSSLDADSEGEEGKFYLWTVDEIRAVLAEHSFSINITDPVSFFIAAYGVKEPGNFEGKTVLQRALTDEELGELYHLEPEQVLALLTEMHSGLLQSRNQRVRPGTDDKVLVAWNALAILAYSEAARYLHREDYLAIAQKCAGFILNQLFLEGRLLRSWRQGRSLHQAYLEDYASLILALISLYQSTTDLQWFLSAFHLTEDLIDHYSDPQGGFYDTRDDQDRLILRPKDIQDNATPSGNSLAARALLVMALYTGNSAWRDIAEEVLGKIQAASAQYPTAFAHWLTALDFAVQSVREIVILGDRLHPLTRDLVEALWSRYRADAIVAISEFPPAREAPALLQDRPLLNDLPTAYICQNFVCHRPVNTPSEMLPQLDEQTLGG